MHEFTKLFLLLFNNKINILLDITCLIRIESFFTFLTGKLFKMAFT